MDDLSQPCGECGATVTGEPSETVLGGRFTCGSRGAVVHVDGVRRLLLAVFRRRSATAIARVSPLSSTRRPVY
ncbi:hypothetical protein [Winogradskya humida]|uniref:hypothetical protein n=1 Tax=Winogradskya humida TaxID=113566 RepID=UPI0019455DBB|nr:hypothetical protein [Actinoplanes humidus]